MSSDLKGGKFTEQYPGENPAKILKDLHRIL